MWAIMVLSAAVFAFFGFQLRFEEDIVKLLPHSATSNELAFTEIGLKDKVFIQATSRDTLHPVGTAALGAAVEEYCNMLVQRDSVSSHIAGILCTLDAETGLNAMDFGMDHLPSFIDPAWYPAIEQALQKEAIHEQMERNYELLMADETGEITQLVSMDPLNLRAQVLEPVLQGIGGLTMEDGHFFCPDKTVALAYLSPAFDPMNSGEATRFVKMMNKTARDFEAAHPDIRILVHGNPQGSVSNAGTIKHDLVWTVGLSLLLILVIMLMSFHKFSFVWQQVLPVVYGSLFSLACLYWIKGYMSLMALGLGAIVLGVAISYCLHVLIHFYYVEDVETMLREESTPVFLGCLTTVGAFMGLLCTESDLLRDFGLFATFALIGNTLYALIFLPHLLKPEQIKFKRVKGFPLVERINSLPWDRNKFVIGGLIILIIVGVAMSPRVQFDADLRNLDYDDPALTESQDLYNRKNSDGLDHQYFAAWDSDLDAALEYNEALFHLMDSLQASGQVLRYSPITTLLFHSQEDQKERIAAWNAFWTPERVKELSKNLKAESRKLELPEDLTAPFLALLHHDYQPGNLIESGIAPNGLLSNFYEHQADGRHMVFADVAYPAQDRDKVWGALTQAEHVFVLEPFYYCRDMVQIVHDDFSTTLWISSLFVLLVLLFSFRNIWIAILAFFPMFVSWYVMQGYMALLGLEFNLINIIISTFIYGIGVDYSIFVMEGLLAQARRGQTDMLSNHKVAIFYSAMVLAIVTFSLIFATHPSIHSIGIITLIGMASTILITYSLQPWLFRLLTKSRYFRRSFHIPE